MKNIINLKFNLCLTSLAIIFIFLSPVIINPLVIGIGTNYSKYENYDVISRNYDETSFYDELLINLDIIEKIFIEDGKLFLAYYSRKTKEKLLELDEEVFLYHFNNFIKSQLPYKWAQALFIIFVRKV